MSVSESIAHDAAELHVTGRARYIDDIPVPANTLHLAFGLSQTARGRLVSVELEAVRAAEGVAGAFVAADLPAGNDTSPVAHDEPMLADGEVRHIGQPVFLVAASSHLAARRAARLGRIDCEEQPPVLSCAAALEADSRFGAAASVFERGDAAAAIAAAPHVVEGTIRIGGQEHFYLEGQAALAIPQDNGDMVVHSSTQHPTEVQHKVAETLGVPMHAVRVEVRRMGGGFGGKESQGSVPACACAAAARLTGRPCKMRYDRDDDFMITGKRHDFEISYRAGVDAEGRILGIEYVHLARCGWSQDLSMAVADRAMLHADNAYHLPNVRIESHRLKTNTQSATAFRGFGGPQGMLGAERVIDHIAAELGRDPLDVRRVNFYADAGAAAEPQLTPYWQEVSDCCVNAMAERLRETAQYDRRRAEIREWNAANGTFRRGLALTPVKFGISFTLTFLNQAGALVHVYQDGSVFMNHGGTEMGQGLFQKIAQVAASRFGIPLGMVKITATDTGKVPNTSATAASSGSDLNGMAVKAACDTIRDRMAAHVAERHQIAPEEVRFEGGRVFAGAESYSFGEVAASAHQARVSLSATGYYRTPDIEWDAARGRGRPCYYYAYGVSASEVVIDTRTGESRILRADILHDAGSSLNPAIDLGQIEGGYVQGAGWLTTEELVWDERGALRTHAPSTYKIPACSDRPADFRVDLWDAPNPEPTIYRSKAVGEPPLMHGISAFLAISDAIASCGDGGHVALDAPATPEAVLMAIRRLRGAA